jgi:hypothetical protein
MRNHCKRRSTTSAWRRLTRNNPQASMRSNLRYAQGKLESMKSLVLVMSLVACCLQSFGQVAEQKGPVNCSQGNIAGAAPELVDKVGRFLTEFQTALAKDDRIKVALLVNYPVSAANMKRKFNLKTEEEFLQAYDEFFTPLVKKIIAAQRPSCVNLMGSKGFMLARGEVWFTEYPGGHMRIFAINPPIPGLDGPTNQY